MTTHSPTCICPWHLGMGPRLDCPIHGRGIMAAGFVERAVLAAVPPVRSHLSLDGSFGGVVFHLTHPKPNRWHRFWYRVLLGWHWRDAP